MAFFEFEGKRPSVGQGTFVHPEATLIGDVRIGDKCFVGAGARIRGDWGTVLIGSESNIQENCVIHVLVNRTTQLGPRSHIGHGAILHCCTLGEHVVVGIGAIILDGAVIGDGVCIGAGSVVTEKSFIPANQLVMGTPGRPVKEISPELRRRLDEGTDLYAALPARCLKNLRLITE